MSSLPNVHPFLVHFPIAIFTTALGCDLALWLGARRPWLDRSAVLLYVTAALTSGAAALTGKLAADAMASEIPAPVDEAIALHGDWAFFSVVLLFVVAALRFDASWRDRMDRAPKLHRVRLVALVIALGAQWVLVHTAARGGELVYHYGVGVRDHEIIPGGGKNR